MTDIFSSFINVKKYAIGNGIVDDSSALIAANAEASAVTSGSNTIFLPNGTYRLGNNVTISSNVKLLFDAGASISVDSGKTFIINGMVEANPYSIIFDGYGAGVSFGSNGTQVRELSVIWFGADPTGNNISSTPFANAVTAMPNIIASSTGPHWNTVHVGPTYPNPTSLSHIGCKLIIPAGVYWLTSTWNINRIGVTVEGANYQTYQAGTSQLVTAPGITAIQLPSAGGQSSISNLVLSHGGSNPNGNYNGVTAQENGPGQFYPHWLSGTHYNVGDIVVANQANKYGYAFQCTVSGTSAGSTYTYPTPPANWRASEPAWDRNTYPIDTTPIIDNTVTWQPIEAHGMNIQSSFNTIRNVWMFGYPGNGFNINSTVTGSEFANHIENCGHMNLGGSGIFAQGGNTGENIINGFQGYYSRGWHVRDECGSYNVYINITMEDCEAGLFYAAGGAGMFIGGYKEQTDSGAVLGLGATAIGINFRPTASGANVGFSGFYAPTWTPNTVYAAGSYIVPIAQPDGYEGYIWRTVSGGTSGSSPPTWYPGYGSGTIPDRSTVVDNTVTWVVNNYSALSNGNIIGEACSPVSLVKTWSQYQINLALANSGLSGSVSGSDNSVLAFNTNDANDTAATILTYDPIAKWYVWAHNSSGIPGMAHVMNNSIYSSSGALTTTSAAFPGGFYLGTNFAGYFTQVLGGAKPGINYAGTKLTQGSTFITGGNESGGINAGGAGMYRAISGGHTYATWKPAYNNYTIGTLALAMPSNGHLYKCTTTGISGTVPVVWPTTGGTVSDGYAVWQDMGTSVDGYSVWLPTAPNVGEDIYLLNLTGAGGTYTLSAEECAHRVIRVFNASGATTLVVKTSDIINPGSSDTAARNGAINTWSKIFDNMSGQTITIAATVSDTGVAITNGNNSFLWSDGINVKKTS